MYAFGFRTPPPREVSFISTSLHVVDSQLQRVLVKTDAGIMAAITDTHGFSNLPLCQAVIEGQKVISQPERSHTVTNGAKLIHPSG